MFNYIFNKKIITSHKKILDKDYQEIILTNEQRIFGFVDDKGKIKIDLERKKKNEKPI